MIIINGLKFCDSKKDCIDTLFNRTGTASGYTKRRTPKSVVLYSLSGEIIAHISRNKQGYPFFGNAWEREGKVLMQVDLSEPLKTYFGLGNMSYTKEQEFIEILAKQAGI